jgi:cytochrome d ubiquinol oxidase subunit I
VYLFLGVMVTFLLVRQVAGTLPGRESAEVAHGH